MRVDELRRLLSEGTAGEWAEGPPGVVSMKPGDRPGEGHDLIMYVDRKDARLIVALHNAAPALLKVMEAAEAVSGEAPLLGPHNMLCVVDPKKIDALRRALEAFHAL